MVLHAELGLPVLYLVSHLGAEALCAYVPFYAVDFLKLSTGLLEDPAVHKRHNDQRDVEGDNGGGHGIGSVSGEVTAGWVLQAAQCLRFI